MTQKPKQTTCIIEGCTRMARVRGVCGPCYEVLKKHVDSGKITWKQAEKAGLIHPSRKPSPMRLAIEKGGQA